MHVEDAVDAQDVGADVGEIDSSRRRLEQHVEGLPEQVPGARHDEAADDGGGHDVGRVQPVVAMTTAATMTATDPSASASTSR